MAQSPWLLLVYRVPTEPASKRVTVWRELKRLGAYYPQQCVAMLPDLPELRAELEQISGKIESFDGESTLFEVPRLRPHDETRIVEAFRALRNHEYQEIIEECQTKFVKEIEFEHFRQNYSFEEAEEIGQDLEKIRRWFDRIVARDWFAASMRADVEQWIEHCTELLSDFEQTVYQRSPDDTDKSGLDSLKALPTLQSLPPPVKTESEDTGL